MRHESTKSGWLRLQRLFASPALLLLALLWPSGDVTASEVSHALARLEVADIRRAVGKPLPTMASILGEDLPPPGPVVVLADFDEDAAGCADQAQGQALGALLRLELWGRVPGVAFAHPIGYWMDGRADQVERPGPRSRRVQARSGAQWRLVGTRLTNGAPGAHRLSLLRHEAGAETTALAREWHSSDAELPGDALAVAQAMLAEAFPAAAGPRLQPHTLHPAHGFVRLRQALQAVCEGAGYVHELERAWNDAPDSATIAALFVGEIGYLYEDDVRAPILAAVASQHRDHPWLIAGVGLQQLALSDSDAKGDSELRPWVARLLPYRHEPVTLYVVADAYASLERMYSSPDGYRGTQYVVAGPVPHHPRLAAGLAVAIEAYRRNPADFRASWTLAYALSQYTDSVRGAYTNPPASARERVPTLLALMREAAARAARQHGAVYRIRELQLIAAASTGMDWWHHFEAAVALAPQYPWIYRAGINYAGRPWGGTAELRARIYRLAKSNNPGADWPRQMYIAWTPRSEWWPVVYGPWLRGLGLLVALAVLAAVAFRWQRRTGSR